MQNNVVYHGSAVKIETTIPRRNVRMSDSQIVWDRASFHATPYRWIALAYMRNKSAFETTGIDLYHYRPVVEIIGPTTLENALKNLYSEGGYLYEFDARDFSHAEGLGNLEVFTDRAVQPVRATFVTNPVAEMEKEGVTFLFTRKEDPKGN